MQMPKPSDEDKSFFRGLVPDDPRVEVKPMFGNLAAFVNGNMFMGLFGAAVGLKVDDPDRLRLLDEPGAGSFGPAERPMGGYASLPPSWRADPARAESWVQVALEHVASLPPKKARAKPAAKSPGRAG